MSDHTRRELIIRSLIAAVAIVVVSVTWYQRNSSVVPSPVLVTVPEAWQVPATAPAQVGSTVPLDENVYYPEARSISDCTGFVERPGCGSSARGGQAQTVLFVALMGALGFIGWRIFRGMRRQPS